MNAELSSIIARLPAWSGMEINQIERIAGLTNVNYRITVNGEPFFLRISGKNTQRTGLISPVEGFDYLEFAQYLFANDIRELQRLCAGNHPFP